MPQPRPNSAPYKNLMLAFAYTRTVVWANANGCEKASQSLPQRLLHPTRTGIVLCKELSEQKAGGNV